MLWVCDSCGTAYAADLSTCPHCGGSDFHQKGRNDWIKENNVPKITVNEGPSDITGQVAPTPEAVEPGPADEDQGTTAANADGQSEVAADKDQRERAEEPRTGEAVVERPAVNDRKADWVDYAVALGVDRDEAEGNTKSDLIELCDRREAEGY